jgi:site-specific DNA-methyltransferase (adenine-specific)
VELPKRLIELYTYRGDLVLDPFMGAGSTAVAAVRTERYFVGFDTDADYVSRAVARVAAEPSPPERVVVPPGASTGSGAKATTVAQTLLAHTGYSAIEQDVMFRDLGVDVTFRARDADGAGVALRAGRSVQHDPPGTEAGRRHVARPREGRRSSCRSSV